MLRGCLALATAAAFGSWGSPMSPPAPNPSVPLFQFVAWAQQHGVNLVRPACASDQASSGATVTCYGISESGVVSHRRAGPRRNGGRIHTRARVVTDRPGRWAPSPAAATTSLALAAVEGSGSDVVDLPAPVAELAVIDVDFSGDELSSITITALDSGLADAGLFLAPMVLASHGRFLFDATDSPVSHLQIESTGTWRIQILPISAVDAWDGPRHCTAQKARWCVTSEAPGYSTARWPTMASSRSCSE